MLGPATHFYAQRLKNIQKKISVDEAYLISKATDIIHFTGFPQLVPEERESLLIITKNKAFLFHHNFSPTLKNFPELIYIPQTNLSKIEEILKQENTANLSIDEQTLVAKEFKFFKKLFKKNIIPMPDDFIWQFRLQKDELALANQQRAGQIIAQVFEKISQWLHAGITEKQLAGKIIGLMMEMGSEGPAFPTIVAFGSNGALPHHQPTDKKLKQNTAVLIDAGAKFNGYRSDMTRTFWFGKKQDQEFLDMEKIVKQAYQESIKIIEKGAQEQIIKDIDDAARSYIERQGLGNEFIHTTGHGIGLDIHEPPSVSWMNKDTLLPNTTITIEPGIYIIGKFGYRYENTIYVTKNSYQVITKKNDH
jgi:Xaa-Pro aminopeptidase